MQEGCLGHRHYEHAERNDASMEWRLRVVGTVRVYEREKTAEKLRLSKGQSILNQLEDRAQQERSTESLKHSQSETWARCSSDTVSNPVDMAHLPLLLELFEPVVIEGTGQALGLIALRQLPQVILVQCVIGSALHHAAHPAECQPGEDVRAGKICSELLLFCKRT